MTRRDILVVYASGLVAGACVMWWALWLEHADAMRALLR